MRAGPSFVVIALLLGGLGPGAAWAGPTKVLFAVGDNVGDPEDPVLHHADEDARGLAQVMVDVGGMSTDRQYVLTDETADVVRSRFYELTGRIAELARAGQDVQLYVYVSSHAKDGQLHLRGTHLALTELRQLAERTRARLRVLVIDACDSGMAARTKGGHPGPAYDVQLERLPLAGTVVITSSGPAEPSEEWDSIGGSLFTHHVLTGLRGDADADGDGQVTLAEVYAYAYRRTVAGASQSTQHPAFDYDLSGTGELVVSTPRTARSVLVFPATLEGRYLLVSQPRSDVVAEIDKQAGRVLRLAVPRGHYLLRKPMGARTGLLTLDLPYEGETEVSEASMVQRHFAEVGVKGGYVELHPWSLEVLGGISTSPYASGWGRWNTGLALRRTDGAFYVELRALFGADHFSADRIAVHENALGLGLSAGFRWLLPTVVPSLGLLVSADGYQQGFRWLDAADALALPPIPRGYSLGVSGGPILALEIPLTRHFSARVSGEALLSYLPVENASALHFVARGEAGLGWTF